MGYQRHKPPQEIGANGAAVAKPSVVVELTPSVGGVLTVNPKFACSGAVPSRNARFGISSQNEPGSAPRRVFPTRSLVA